MRWARSEKRYSKNPTTKKNIYETFREFQKWMKLKKNYIYTHVRMFRVNMGPNNVLIFRGQK